MITDEWFSDTANAKLAEIERKTAAGEKVTTDDLCGVCEPRTPPTASQRCVCCGVDAREKNGGGDGRYGRYCFICIGRGHHE